MAKTALPGKRKTVFLVPLDDVVLVTDPGHPLYDARVMLPPDDAIVRNMMVHGVKVAIKVRKNGETVEVVDGRRRVVNAREASRRLVEQGGEALLVPVEIERGGDAEMADAMVFLNELRRQDDPIEKARKMQRYLSLGRTEVDLGAVWGIGVVQVKNYLALLDLAPQVQAAIAGGSLGMMEGLRQYGKMTREEQTAHIGDAGSHAAPSGGRGGGRPRRGANGTGTRAPNKAKVREVADALGRNGEQALCAALRWAVGDLGADDLPAKLRKAVSNGRRERTSSTRR